MSAEMPIALISGAEMPFRSSFWKRRPRDGTLLWVKGKLSCSFYPRSGTVPADGVESQCSRFGVTAEAQAARPQEDWLYLGCRLVGAEGEEHRTSSLEVFVLWMGSETPFGVEDMPTAQTSAAVWLLRLRSQPGSVRLKGGARDVTIRLRNS